MSFIGAAIAPGSKDIYRVIVAQILIGVGFAAVPLAYSIPSEVSSRAFTSSMPLTSRSYRDDGGPVSTLAWSAEIMAGY